MMGSGSSKRGGGPAAARAATHRFEFDLNGHHYSFDTVQSDIEIETYPPYQIFELTSKATVPLKEEDEVLNFTIYNLGRHKRERERDRERKKKKKKQQQQQQHKRER